MKRIIIISIALLFSVLTTEAQNLYFTKTGHAYFMSHTDAINIDGNNNQTTSFFNADNGEIAFQMLVKSFKFTLATAEEHFNETYMESDKFPKASLKGTVTNLKEINLNTNGTYKALVKGDLNIHGISRPVEQEGTVTVKDGKISAVSAFKINIDDYGIKVPKIVEDRVAKVVDVKIDLEYSPYKK
ncbi:MAG TPA: YceI family protein [Prolixibacteraceae bacterium]|nr:YceI family protein [Prolixibacteraceae bacterium]HPS11768.1 YceI family protein [Prolixibacteraceae bacterium]